MKTSHTTHVTSDFLSCFIERWEDDGGATAGVKIADGQKSKFLVINNTKKITNRHKSHTVILNEIPSASPLRIAHPFEW